MPQSSSRTLSTTVHRKDIQFLLLRGIQCVCVCVRALIVMILICNFTFTSPPSNTVLNPFMTLLLHFLCFISFIFSFIFLLFKKIVFNRDIILNVLERAVNVYNIWKHNMESWFAFKILSWSIWVELCLIGFTVFNKCSFLLLLQRNTDTFLFMTFWREQN